MQRLVTGADRLIGWISRLAAGLAAIATLLCFGLVCYVVAARYFFGRAPSWSDEVGGWLVVALVMLAIAEAQRRGEHIGVDLLLERTTGRLHRLLKAFGALCVGVSAAVICWEGWETVLFSRMIGARPLSIAEIPMWWIEILIPIGAGLMLLVAVLQFVGFVAGIDLVPEHSEEPRATE